MSQKLLIVMLLCLSAQSALGRTINVCDECDFYSISNAIANAFVGDTVQVSAGVYPEYNILIDKSITIIGIEYPIVDGQNKGEVFTITADNVTVEGLQIQNVGVSHLEDRAAIRIKESKHFKVANNKLYDTFFGIYLEHSSDGVVQGNFIKGDAKDEMYSGNAIHLWYSHNIEVRNNHVESHRDGIYFEFVDSSIVSGNISLNNLRYGLHFMFSNDDNYFDNRFVNNGAGVAVMFSKKINMRDNTFEDNWGSNAYGLLLKEIYDAEIENNKFIRNSTAIYTEGSTRINYRQNTFISNGWAIYISGGCLDNVIAYNDFLSNTFDLALRSNANNNTFDNNYWSSYSGYDLNRDGTGDIPHRPVKLFNYIVNRTPETIVLLRSLFVDIINFSERVSPALTPSDVLDRTPRMQRITIDQQELTQ